MKRITNSSIHVGLFVLLLFTGCTVGRVLSYTATKTEIPSNVTFTYAVATHDQREEVTDKSQPENYVGYMRSTVGIAYPIHTESKRTFSDDFSIFIRNSLNLTSDRCHIVSTHYNESFDQVLDQLVLSKCTRLMLFTIDKWRTDSKPIGFTDYGTDFLWDIRLDIFDNMGEFLATNHIEGIDEGLDLAPAGSIKRIQVIVNDKLKEKIDQLMDNPDIQLAMRGQ